MIMLKITDASHLPWVDDASHLPWSMMHHISHGRWCITSPMVDDASHLPWSMMHHISHGRWCITSPMGRWCITSPMGGWVQPPHLLLTSPLQQPYNSKPELSLILSALLLLWCRPTSFCTQKPNTEYSILSKQCQWPYYLIHCSIVMQ